MRTERPALLSELLDALSPDQRTVVETLGHQLVFACPGSGKTRTLTVRAAWLLERNPSTRLVACTFTVDAAAELRARIAQATPTAVKRVSTGTFHSLALSQLRSTPGLKMPRVLSAAEQSALVRAAWLACAPNSTLQEVSNEIERAKSTLQPNTANIDQTPALAAFVYYQERLAKLNVCDFSDLVRDAVLGMRDGTVKPLDVDALLVDEFQDADPVQLEWVNQHALAGVEITVVGDDDQSLYGWRHALGYSGMRAFAMHNQAVETRLDTCYRCADQVLSHARTLIGVNEQRQAKQILGLGDREGSISLVVKRSRDVEADEVAAAVLASPPEESWAVLARTNRQLDVVEASFTSFDIPYLRVGGTSFWEGMIPGMYRALIRTLIAGDRLGLNLLFDRLLPSERSRERFFSQLPSRRGHAIDQLIETPPSLTGFDPLEVTAVRTWIDALKGQRKLVQQGRSESLAHSLADRLSPLFQSEYAESILGLCASTFCRLSGSPRQRLNGLERASSKGKQETGDRVKLMTLHTSKGLEFDRVWIVGMEHGVLPHERGEIDEERRLCYVGMTRARNHLTLSYASQRVLRGEWVRVVPSQFLSEAGLPSPEGASIPSLAQPMTLMVP